MALRKIIDKILGNVLVIIMGVMVINVLWQVFTRFILVKIKILRININYRRF